MTPPAPLRVGVVGTGGMARAHLSAWRELGVGALVLSRSGSRGRAASLAAEYGAQAADSLPGLLAASDAIDICTPTETHRALAVAAFDAGRHVICEKPIALTSADAQAMAARARATGRQLHVAHVVRYFAAYAAAHGAVRDGRVGAPRTVRLTRIGAAPTAPWFHDETRSGGVLMDQLIHDFDFARWVAGDVRVVEARVRRRGANYVTAEATMHHVGGAVSHLAGGWVEPKTPFTTAFVIAGPNGELTHRSSGDTPGAVLLTRAGGEVEEVLAADAVAADRPFVTQLREFAAAIAGGDRTATELRITVGDALAALELALAARQSARSGRPEPVRRP